jgi:hypothetical protein
MAQFLQSRPLGNAGQVLAQTCFACAVADLVGERDRLFQAKDGLLLRAQSRVADSQVAQCGGLAPAVADLSGNREAVPESSRRIGPAVLGLIQVAEIPPGMSLTRPAWDLVTGGPLRSLGAARGCLAVSPDGRYLATGDELLRLRTEGQRGWSTGGENPRARFSPDGRHLAVLCGPHLSVWSMDPDFAPRQSARLQSADQRAVVFHLRAAVRPGADREALLFHLKRVEGLPLASAWEYVARARLYWLADRRQEAEADFARARALAPEIEELAQGPAALFWTWEPNGPPR